MLIWEDGEIYDELLDDYPTMTANTGKGLSCIIEDVLSFYLVNRLISGENIVPAYRCRQVKADKMVGSGEDIRHGQRVYAYRKNTALPWTTPQDMWVSHNRVGTVGTNYMFCGWAKEDADEDDTTVEINFDGTRPEIGH